ncbi:MAG: methyltransferase domain-containing protein [Acidobacteria bacterium]|nr:methyltransferase domain-containing protein [Acidobacteriota bacterium]
MRSSILDMMGNEKEEVITPFQRIMQTPPIVAIYEKIWRRIGYYLASSRSFSREMQTVIEHARGKHGERALDLACGPGVFTRPLARLSDGLVIGLDLSMPMLLRARKCLQKEGIQNAQLIRATAFHMPFADSTFQYVNCCGALHLFDRPETALVEIARVLDSKGFLCVQTTIRPARSAGIAYFLERFIRFGFFNEEELKKLLHQCGFKLIESQRNRISFTFLAKPVT